MQYIDIATLTFDTNGNLHAADLFKPDRCLHPTARSSHARWTATIKPILLLAVPRHKKAHPA